jgi:hypothetical protein
MGQEFKVNDKVRAFGCVGFVKTVSPNGYLHVKFPECPDLVVFRTDGKIYGWSKVPVLKKVGQKRYSGNIAPQGGGNV